MAYSFGTNGSVPLAGNQAYAPANGLPGGTPAARALNGAASSSGGLVGAIGSGLSALFKPAPAQPAVQRPSYMPAPQSTPGLLATPPANQDVASQTITDAAGNSHTTKYQPSGTASSTGGTSQPSSGSSSTSAPSSSPSSGYTVDPTTGVATGTFQPGQSQYNMGPANNPAGSAPTTFTTPSGATVDNAGNVISIGQNAQNASNAGSANTATGAGGNTYGGLINQAASAAGQNAAIGQNAAAIAADYGKQIAQVGQQGAGAEAGYRSTGTSPVAVGNAGLIAQNVAAQQTALAQGEQAALQGTGQQLTAQQQEQTGLLGAGGLAAPSNANVTAPAGGVTTNTLTGQQYSNPIYGAPGMLQPYSPQPGGTAGQPATAGQTPPYTVQAGDTLDQIAAANGTTVAALQALNPSITDPNKITTGQQIKLPPTAGATPFTGGQAQGAAQQGAQYQANNATIIKAQGIQQKMNQEIVQNGINSLSSLNVANALNQWVQGNLSNPAYQNFFQDLTDYTQTIAPLIGITGTITDMKTGIAQNLLSSTASGDTIMQGLNNLNTLALNSNEALLKAGSAPVGQGATPTGQNNGASNSGSTYTAADGNGYAVTQDSSGHWTVTKQ
jgi:LysM repeat protein